MPWPKSGWSWVASPSWKGKRMENLTYLFAAYTAIWILVFAYLVRLQRREKILRQELDQLRQRLSGERRGLDP